ncbi:MAG TPA: glycosyltransferase [Rhodanobacteraceae bacterium]
MAARAKRIMLVLPSLGRGGGEHVFLQLAGQFLDAGREVHVVALLGGGPLGTCVPHGATLHELADTGSRSHGLALARRSLPKFVSLLRDARPDAVLSTMTGANLLVALAHRRARSDARLVLREASSLVNVRSALKRRAMRWLYRRADALVGVSAGVAQDLRSLGLDVSRIRVIHNPVDAMRLRQLAAAGPTVESLAGVPYIVALGRLTAAKDYPTLLRAFAASTLRHSHGLVVVGGGEARENLEALARELGLAAHVLLLGAMDNPYRVLAGASLFVLSSRWEGYPNALLEALALHVPVVATDCLHGPREILAGGRYGRLVPVGDARALARAMDAELAAPSARGDDVVVAHAPRDIATQYLALLDGAGK